MCWQAGAVLPGHRHAVDAEILGQPVPRALARRAAGLPPERVWWLWTRAEARAKVLDVPILVWISRVDWLADAAHPSGGAYDETAVLTRHLDDLVVSHAVRPSARR